MISPFLKSLSTKEQLQLKTKIKTVRWRTVSKLRGIKEKRSKYHSSNVNKHTSHIAKPYF